MTRHDVSPAPPIPRSDASLLKYSLLLTVVARVVVSGRVSDDHYNQLVTSRRHETAARAHLLLRLIGLETHDGKAETDRSPSVALISFGQDFLAPPG